MDNWYWIIEYGKVFGGYLFFMFLWPSVVFGGHLKEKGKGYRFSFCVTVQVVIANTVVLLLGLFHILHPQLTAVLFYGVFLLALMKKLVRHPFSFQAKKAVKEIWWKFREHLGEYSILILLLLFGVIYFSYGTSQIHSYGCGDLYVHHKWIYGLLEGKIFEDGVYPEAMHCFIYCLNALFGIRVYSSLMFLQGIHVAVFLITGYLLLRDVFHWRYTPFFVLALFLTLDLLNADQIRSFFRLQMTLPLEFGLYTQFLCALSLMRFLKNTKRIERKGKLSKYYWDENLFLFLLSLAASISIHFYTTIMAFVLCLSFAVFMLKRLLMREHFIPLTVSVLCACMIAIMPMAGACISGIPLNYSLNWAVTSMDGEETREVEAKLLEEESTTDETPEEKIPNRSILFEKLTGVYKKGYVALYGISGVGIILFVTGAVAALCLLSRRKSADWLREICRGYPPLILSAFLFVLLYAAPLIGIPEIISNERVCSTGHMLMMALMMIPADVVFSILARFCRDMVLQLLSAFSVAGIYVLTILTGHFHGYLFFELSRYNSAVEVTNSIIEEFPEKSYVIVSPTDELYSVIEYGWHEELLTFVQNCNNENYMVETEYVFIYVEKKPLQYAQAYFFDGPSWLARLKYKDIYWKKYSKLYQDTGAAQAPEINASEISDEAAQKVLVVYRNPWYIYTKLPARTNLESKAYDWCQRFSELHPEEMKIYYEDDDFICYYFRQDGDVQYQLGIR